MKDLLSQRVFFLFALFGSYPENNFNYSILGDLLC